MNNKNTCKLVCENQCLENDFLINVSDFSMSLTNTAMIQTISILDFLHGRLIKGGGSGGLKDSEHL